MPLEGLQLGRYHFIRLLGSGGMGQVYLAEDPRINQQVAIKVIRAEASPYPNDQAIKEASRLFQREAMAVAQLDHPHILPLFDFGEAMVHGTPLSYLVMPYRPEGSLVEWLNKRGTAKLLTPQEVARIIGQTSDALQHAHDRQIIHQDVKPSNLLIRERREDLDHPDILLADFGISRTTTETSSASQVIRGTPTYMAPEQWEGHPVFATDQYALAIMAYELLTGRPPFQGGSVQMMYHHLNTLPPALSSFNTNLSGDVDAVILHALAKKPQDRFDSIAAFADSFSHATQGIDVSIPSKSTIVLGDKNTSPVNPSPITPSNRNSDDKRRGLFKGRIVLLIMLALLIIASSIVALFVFNNNRTATGNTNATATSVSASAFYSTATSQASKATATSQNSSEGNNNSTSNTNHKSVPFQVTSIDISVLPNTISGLSCGTQITVTYTATFNVLPNGPGGPIQFTYTTDGGQTSKTGVVQFSPGQTSMQFQFPASGTLVLNGAFPGAGQVTATSPNTVSSNAVTPSGTCTPLTPSPTPDPTP